MTPGWAFARMYIEGIFTLKDGKIAASWFWATSMA